MASTSVTSWRAARAASKSRSSTLTAIRSSCLSRLAAPEQPHGRITLEQVEAQPGRLPSLAGEAPVAVKEEAGVALGDRSKLGHIFRRGDAEILLAGLARAEDLARTAQAQIF